MNTRSKGGVGYVDVLGERGSCGEAVGERSLLVDVDVARAAGTAPFGAVGDLTQRLKFGEEEA